MPTRVASSDFASAMKRCSALTFSSGRSQMTWAERSRKGIGRRMPLWESAAANGVGVSSVAEAVAARAFPLAYPDFMLCAQMAHNSNQ